MMKVTFIICSINIEKLIISIDSILPYLSSNQLLIILDGINSDKIGQYDKYSNINFIINKKNMGLSYSRNMGLKIAKTKYIVFFDDDIELKNNIIVKYNKYFSKGYDILGGPLSLPKDYKVLPFWLSEGYSYLFTIHTINKRIWGANFGFNLELSKKHNLKFDEKLGRRGKGLESGDDTTFVKQLSKFTNNIAFFDDLAIDHRFDKKRYLLPYHIKRVFWQGRSEVRRNSILSGIEKEIKRAFYFKKSFYLNLIPFFTSISFIFIFISGIIYEKITLINGVFNEKN